MGISMSTLLLARKYADAVGTRLTGEIEGSTGKRAETYVYEQNPASDLWTINHNLDNYPSVTVVDSAGSIVYGDVRYPDKNTVVVQFHAAFSGKAYLN